MGLFCSDCRLWCCDHRSGIRAGDGFQTGRDSMFFFGEADGFAVRAKNVRGDQDDGSSYANNHSFAHDSQSFIYVDNFCLAARIQQASTNSFRNAEFYGQGAFTETGFSTDDI